MVATTLALFLRGTGWPATTLGRLQREKQGDPAPLAGSSAHPHSGAKTGKRKAGLEAKSLREGTTGSPRGGGRGGRGGGRGGRGRDTKGRETGGFMSGRGSGGGDPERAAKKSKKNSSKKSKGGMDDESESEVDSGDEVEDRGLEAARSALFNDEDLAPPTAGGSDIDLGSGDEDRESDDEEDGEDDEMLEDDEFDLGEDEEEGVEGVTLDDFEMTAEEAEQMPASGKKAAKRAARAVYNSDDEEATQSAPAPRAAKAVKAPAAVEGQEEDATLSELEADSEDEIEEGTLDDLRAVERRMRTSARVLANWKELGPASGKSRSDLVEQLIGDVCQYHGYTPFLAEKFFDLYGVDEALQFFNASDTPRPVTLRVNTLKTRRRDLAQALINRGVNLEPLAGGWSKVGLQVFSGGGVPVGATPEYLAGHYILQSASSFLPVISLSPQPHERVLDMSAAPGGKTTYMSALMGNTGEVWANDSSRGRIKGLAGNIARLGCKNVIITNVDGREFPKIIGGFDRVLLDAPCSGTGVISKDQSVKVNKSERDFTLLSHLQKQLILCAIDSVSPNSATGGYIVYSTCSVMTEENEAVVSYALRKRPHAKIVETGLTFGTPGFKSYRGKEFGKGMELTRRFAPHRENTDGFYVCKIKVGKPAKKVAEDDSLPESYVPLSMTEEEELANTEDGPSAFDNEGDEKLIQDTKKRQLKKAGVNFKATKGAKKVAKEAEQDD